MVVGTCSKGFQCQRRANLRHGSKSQFTLIGMFLLSTMIDSLVASPIGTSILNTGSMMPTIESLNVKCSQSGMTVLVTFDRPFSGVIYSKGHYYDERCHYINEKNTNGISFSFYIPNNECGTTGRLEDPTIHEDMYFENTVIIQSDPLIQEIWDQARNIRCTWKHTISKSVETKAIKIKEPEKVKVNFDSKSINSLMQIQQGKSPFSSPATGYVYIGQDTSVVIYVQDSSNKLDANVVSCQAYSTTNKAVELVDNYGCLKRPDLMTPFSKLYDPEGVEATLMLYANLKAFQVDEDPSFRISCNLEVCEGKCLEPCVLGDHAFTRSKRQVSATELIELHGGAIVVAKEMDDYGNCSIATFTATTVLILVFSCSLLCCISCYLALKLRSLKNQLNLYVKT